MYSQKKGTKEARWADQICKALKELNIALLVKGGMVQTEECEVWQHDWRWHKREIKNKVEPDVDQAVEVSKAGSLASATRERLILVLQSFIKTDT